MTTVVQVIIFLFKNPALGYVWNVDRVNQLRIIVNSDMNTDLITASKKPWEKNTNLRLHRISSALMTQNKAGIVANTL